MLAATAQADIFATELVSHSASLDGSGLYNDPNDLLGKPTTMIPAWGGGSSHVSIVEPAWSDNVITTFNQGDWAVVKFDHQVMNDAANPYGLDFIVYGNAFFAGSGGFVYDDTDHRDFTIGGGIFEEPLKISVSQNGTDWYTYDNGPYGDSYYPTNPWVWDPDQYDATGNGWTATENDYAKPVDPSLTGDDFADAGNSYAAMLLYDGSAGGMGFDLAESGYDWIEYIRVEGLSGFSGGEIDAFADVAAVPVPGAVWLLGGGLLTLVGVRRRHRT
jgi:hypothetical protein